MSGEVQVVSGEVYPYTFSVRNTSTTSASGARVIDTFPADIELIGTATGTNWTCTSSGQTMDCLYNSIITIATVVPTITVQARIRPTAPI